MENVVLEHRSAFILMAQAENSIAVALLMVDADIPAELADFWILQPSVVVTLKVTHELLGTLANGLDDLELLLETG